MTKQSLISVDVIADEILNNMFKDDSKMLNMEHWLDIIINLINIIEAYPIMLGRDKKTIVLHCLELIGEKYIADSALTAYKIFCENIAPAGIDAFVDFVKHKNNFSKVKKCCFPKK